MAKKKNDVEKEDVKVDYPSFSPVDVDVDVDVETEASLDPDNPAKEFYVDSEGRVPGDKGYNLLEVTRRIRQTIAEARDVVEANRKLLQWVQLEDQAAKPRLNPREASRLTRQNINKNLEIERTRKKKIQETLQEMDLLPKKLPGV